MKVDLTGKTALVTGSGRGLGKSIALLLSECGAEVWICDILEDMARETAEEIAAQGGKSAYAAIDVSQYDQVKNLFDKVIGKSGKLDIVVNCAGIVNTDSFVNIKHEDVEKMLAINVMGVSHSCQLALQHMIPRKQGKIVNISSVSGRSGALTLPHYGMTKAAVINLTQSAALAGAEAGVNVNCICPGIIRTPMWEVILDAKAERSDADKREEAWQRSVARNIPMQKAQEDIDIAWGTVFFCSDFARNITGQSLNIDGGMKLN